MKYMFLFLMFTVVSFGQTKGVYTLVDAKMDKIPNNLSTTTVGIAEYINANFKSENDKIRAAFYWTASNISYDIENIESIDYKEISQDKIKNAVLTKKGVCIHYAEVFNDIAKKVGIKSYLVFGYTKQNGKVDILAHAWCSARIDNVWWLFDPTWGSGYVDKKKFFKKINNLNYKVAPSQFIASHMPFDYLWQFLNQTITNQEFIEGKTQLNKAKTNFDFVAQIGVYDGMSDLDKAKTSLIRMEKNGVKNKLIQEFVLSKKSEVDAIQNNEAMDKMQAISDDYNQAITMFNDFIYYRNNRFKPVLPDDAIKAMIESPKQKMMDCQNRIYKIGAYNDSNTANVKSLKNSIIDILKQIEVQEKFVNDYLSKSKSGRKSMFTTTTFFGIPVR
ncbi:MAG TPA: transglutaminase domain-containing protein [Flavobacterium sp.]|uniref:transglutaminase domain-containing protein n=1 Tax=Flavobacterium sp. TaxID=239 RepID=UPI002DBE941A|nr:transglutaminase domain-containing protein [Flavobacterium sp.]HEU4791212.1 transglutaminase domain-containing protein [Flavobacterium sp.]